MSYGNWITLVGIALTLVGCGWRLSYLLGSLNTRVGNLSDAIARLAMQVGEDRAERRRIWERLDELTARVAVLEARQQ